MTKESKKNLQVKTLHLKMLRVVLAYIFFVSGIWTALSLDASQWVRAGIVSAVWFSLAAIDEIVFWRIMGK